jgi:hypothetical protein
VVAGKTPHVHRDLSVSLPALLALLVLGAGICALYTHQPSLEEHEAIRAVRAREMAASMMAPRFTGGGVLGTGPGAAPAPYAPLPAGGSTSGVGAPLGGTAAAGVYAAGGAGAREVERALLGAEEGRDKGQSIL